MVFEVPTRFGEYLIAAIIIMLAPGPSVLFTIARAISWGRAAAVATVLGNALGMFVLSLAVAFGLGQYYNALMRLFYLYKLLAVVI